MVDHSNVLRRSSTNEAKVLFVACQASIPSIQENQLISFICTYISFDIKISRNFIIFGVLDAGNGEGVPTY